MEKGKKLKNYWMEMPSACFEPLTFGELQEGDQFIALPSPGDNSGHGGFRGSYNLFTKTKMELKELAPGMPYGIPHGEAVNDLGIASGQPNSMFVIKVNNGRKEPLVHAVFNNLPLCRTEIPAGDRFTRTDDLEHITCVVCRQRAPELIKTAVSVMNSLLSVKL